MEILINTLQAAGYMQPCTTLLAGCCGTCNLAAWGASAQQSFAKCVSYSDLFLPSVQHSTCPERMALVPQLNAGCANALALVIFQWSRNRWGPEKNWELRAVQ